MTHAANGLTQVEYFNWSGYGDTNSGKQVYNQVAGSWTQPSVSCTKEDQVVVTWVGLDGLTDGTVEQDGTLIQCAGGTATYFSWWEMFPTNNIQTVSTAVRPGDHITSSVDQERHEVHAHAHRLHSPGPRSFSTTQTCRAGGCVDSSAEWIAEAPTGPTGQFPLADFHSWRVTSASVSTTAKSGVIDTFPADEITMVDSSVTYALASQRPEQYRECLHRHLA